VRFAIAALLAASTRHGVISDLAFVLTVVILYLLPLYIGYRIGTRKGYTGFQWLWRVLLFSWLGVLLLALRAPKPWTAGETRPYHMPPGGNTRAESTLYGQRRGP
jgi:hypothetical protein